MDSKVYSRTLSFAYFYLKFRLRTVAEVSRYLKKKSPFFAGEIADKVIAQLTTEGLLNDERFVSMYIHDRTLLKPRSPFLLKLELSKLGVSKDIIDAYFEKNQTDELPLAYDALKKKLIRFQRLEEKIRNKKAIAYLLRKGFSYDTAKKAYLELFPSDL
ncbi:hypothetical protein COY90_00555 [Candidatus Roizmanbacteria bacterium CG_4_10_14_0_8_um_filter_39_9]|uniref:Regulatory protein RecX n=1 Tax=Candidatus Roizmanbacteria bacterium CG_4_10_14_0_8_um_filter_39_9 TaxID=1974829 RepID=A0A2M7QE00_9BACT|nr:MAG: hypothetical protein COY90_00555 [Candidatus Roizmanbacteria bacterium CG_4_10_14_0_8_um_filter_39_9]